MSRDLHLSGHRHGPFQDVAENPVASTPKSLSLSSAMAKRPLQNSVLSASPYLHQVGGHNLLGQIRGSPNMVAKHIKDEREVVFYEDLAPDELRQFLPRYHGVADVHFSLNDYSPPGSPCSGSRPDSPDLIDAEVSFVDESLVDGALPAGGSPVNPWGLRCYEKQVSGARGGDSSGSESEEAKRCLLLEDVLSDFGRPCVLDLKVGMRTYRDDATPEKRRRAIEKARQTTTGSLGFRLCGMQVFDQDSRQYLCRNKYTGRGLTPDTVKGEVEHFFSSCPHRHLPEMLASLKKQLQQLRSIVAGLRNYRFYSASLLLVYDGEPGTDQAPGVAIKMIDFSNCSHKQYGAVADEGLLLGIANFTALIDEVSGEAMGRA